MPWMKCDLHCRSPHGRCTSVRGQRRAAQRPKLQTVWPGSSIGRLGHSHPVTDTNMSKANLTALTPESIGKWATQKTTRQNMGWKTWTEAKQMAKDRDLGVEDMDWSQTDGQRQIWGGRHGLKPNRWPKTEILGGRHGLKPNRWPKTEIWGGRHGLKPNRWPKTEIWGGRHGLKPNRWPGVGQTGKEALQPYGPKEDR